MKKKEVIQIETLFNEQASIRNLGKEIVMVSEKVRQKASANVNNISKGVNND